MRFHGIATALSIFILASAGLAAPANQLTKAEKTAGWKLLFDGQSLSGWRTAKSEAKPARGWVVEDGWLHCNNQKGGDLLTVQKFDEFELEFEWKLDKGANSGVKYFVVKPRGLSLGHEYQLIDDANHPDAGLGDGKRRTACFYDVIARAPEIQPLPSGEINKSRIVVKGSKVEHWLNGQKAVEYECGSPEVRAAVEASKFKNTPNFGECLNGHILLQDHQSKAWFRNVKIRVLSGQKQ